MRLAAGHRPDPLGDLERSPDRLAAIGGCLLLRGRGEKGKREGRGWEGEGRKGGKGGKGKRERKGWERRKGRGGEGGKEDDLHPTLFLGPDYTLLALL